MIYQVQKNVNQYLFDYRPKHSCCIFFTKNKSSFVDLYVGIAKFEKCCDVVLLGQMCGYIAL